MTRLMKSILGIVFALLLIIVGASYWLTMTASGNMYALKVGVLYVNTTTPFRINIGHFSGRLLESFTLDDVDIKSPEFGKIAVKRVHVILDGNIFSGTAVIKDLQIKDLVVHKTQESSPLKREIDDKNNASFVVNPEAFAIPSILRVFKIDKASFQLGNDKPYKLDYVSGVIQPDQGSLNIQAGYTQNGQQFKDIIQLHKEKELYRIQWSIQNAGYFLRLINAPSVIDYKAFSRFEGTGAFTVSSKSLDVQLMDIKAYIHKKPLHLTLKGQGIFNKMVLDIRTFRLEYAGGVLTGGANITPKDIDVGIKTTGFPLGFLNLSGIPLKNPILKGGVSFKGPLLKLHILADLLLETNVPLSKKGVFPLQTIIKAETVKGDLHTKIILNSQGKNLLTATAVGGQRGILQQYGILKTTFESQLNWLPSLLNLKDVKIAGVLRGEVNIPLKKLGLMGMSGKVSLNKGGISLPKYDIDLRHIVGMFDLKEGIFSIQTLTAKDFGQGLLSIKNGHVDLDTMQLKDIQVSLKNLQLMHIPDIKVPVSGKVSLDGAFKNLKIKGNLKTEKAHINIERALTLRDKYQQKKPEASERNTTQKESDAIHLDIKIDIPQNLSLTGFGLEALMQGKGHLQGSSADLDFSGKASFVKGTYAFLGKELKIKSGDIKIEKQHIDFDIVALMALKGLDVFLGLKGRPDDVNVSLTSNPSLPPQAILARVLLGEELRSINPLRALELLQFLPLITGNHSLSDLNSKRLMQKSKALSKTTQSSHRDKNKKPEKIDPVSLVTGLVGNLF